MNKVALIIGSGGLVGSQLTKIIKEDKRYSKVICLVRKITSHESGKIEVIKGDVKDPESFKLGPIDDVFICVGTTQKKTPNPIEYRSIDYGIPVSWAQWAAKNTIQNYIVISALGANENSKIFYNRLKGEMEEEVFKILPETSISVRPSLLLGNRKEKRLGERMAIWLNKFLGFLIPAKYKGISGESVAKAMVFLANNQKTSRVFESKSLKDLAKKD